MRRRYRRASPLDLVYLVLGFGLLVGGSLWLDRRGAVVTARIEGKHERVRVGVDPTGAWDRYYDAATALRLPDCTTAQARVSVPRERYDALQPGDSIAVRYLPELPFLARTADRTTASIAWEFARRVAEVPILVWVIGGIVGLWTAARIGAPVVLATGVAWTAAAFPLLFAPKAQAEPSGEPAMARVTNVTAITKSPSYNSGHRHSSWSRTSTYRRLAIPYQVIELALPRPGGRDTVLAVDAVDSGSVAGLAFGAVLPVRVDPLVPREAKLVGGTRHFVQRNRYHFLIPAVGCGILGTLAGLGYRHRRRRVAANPSWTDITNHLT